MTQKMRIAIISELEGGGVEKVNTVLAHTFHQLGQNVEIVSLVTDPKEIDKSKFLFPCVYLNLKSKKVSIKALINELKRYKADIVLTSGFLETYFAVFYKYLYHRNTRVVYALHSVYSMAKGSTAKQRILNEILPRLSRLFNLVDGIVFVSNGVKIDFEKYFNRYKANRRVIYNPITSNQPNWRFKPIDCKQISLVTAGRLEEEKRQETLLEALSLLRHRGVNVSATILGEGSRMKHLTEQCKKLDIEQYVTFTGFVTNPEERMKECDIFILTSAHESFGNVIIEAMSSGLPIVSTDCPVGPAEILVNGQFGQLVPVGDSNALTKAISYIIDTHCYNSVKAAYDRSLDFSVQNSANGYLAFFEELLQK